VTCFLVDTLVPDINAGYRGYVPAQ
jgi:hypothetical protein